jgi:hypothetical protein
MVVKSHLVDDSIYADFAASLISGFVVCLGMNPFDVVSTRMYNQPIDHTTRRGLLYRNLGDCFVKTVRSEGFGALYKGFGGTLKSINIDDFSTLSPRWTAYDSVFPLSGAVQAARQEPRRHILIIMVLF